MAQADTATAKPRLGMDPIRFEVMRSAFNASADEMGSALRRASYSTNIKTRADFSCALFDAQLRVIAQSFSQPIHLASMSRMVPSGLRIYGPERLAKGDAIVFNNPHQGAMHLNDIAVISAIYHGSALCGYAAAVAHHVDIGGMTPGGLAVSTDVYQEGVIIPPTKLVADGQLLEEVFELIVANIRSPRQMAGDFRAQIAAVMLGERRFGEVVERFGADEIGAFTNELIEYTRRWTEAELRRLPEGTYRAEGVLDDDGLTDAPIHLVVATTIEDGRIHFDLSGSSPQRRGPMNANLTYAYAALSYVVKCLVDGEIAANAGFYAQIEVVAPHGTVVNARPPAGMVGGGEVSMRLVDIGFLSLAEALSERVAACGKSIICHMGVGGLDPSTDDYYTFMETLAGGYGARPTKDGLDAVQAHFQNTENSAVEETENNLPIRVLRYELVPDSEGAGRYRGGLGLQRDWQFVDHRATFTVFSDMRVNAPWGLFGGASAAPARYIYDPEGEARELPSKFTIELPENGIMSYRTPGGGGYGPPLERNPEAVRQDVLDGRVSAERAAAVYGVVIDRETGQIDAAATVAARNLTAQS